MEVVGTVASIAQLAGTTYKLSKTLYELGDALANATEDIRALAHDLSLFSKSLSQLQRLLDLNKGTYSLDIYTLAHEIIRDCSKIHNKIEKLITKLTKDGTKGRFKWLYKEKRIRDLMGELRDMKITLLGILSTLQLDLQLNHLHISSESAIERRDRSVVNKDEAGESSTGSEVDYIEWRKLQEASMAANTPPKAAPETSSQVYSNSDAITQNHWVTAKEDDTRSIVTMQTFHSAVSSQQPEMFGACGEKEKKWRLEMAELAIAHFTMSFEDATAWAERLPLPEVLSEASKNGAESDISISNPPELPQSLPSPSRDLHDTQPQLQHFSKMESNSSIFAAPPHLSPQLIGASASEDILAEKTLPFIDHNLERSERDYEARASSLARVDTAMRSPTPDFEERRKFRTSRTFRYQFDADSEENFNNLDGDLGSLGVAARLNLPGRASGQVIEEQNKHIDSICSKNDRVDDQIVMNRARLDRITTESAEARGTDDFDKILSIPRFMAFGSTERTSRDERMSVMPSPTFVPIGPQRDDMEDIQFTEVPHPLSPPLVGLDTSSPSARDIERSRYDVFAYSDGVGISSGAEIQGSYGILPLSGNKIYPQMLSSPPLHLSSNMISSSRQEQYAAPSRASFPSESQLTYLWWQAYARLQDLGASDAHKLAYMLSRRSVQDATNDDQWTQKTGGMVEKLTNLRILLHNAPLPHSQSLTAGLSKVEQLLKVLKTVESTLGYKTAAPGWYSICRVVEKMLSHQTFKQAMLDDVVDIVGLTARYAVMENIYRQWEGMSLTQDYRNSLIELCSHILQYLAQATILCQDEAPEQEGISQLKRLFDRIHAADLRCRNFTVIVETDASTSQRSSSVNDIESGEEYSDSIDDTPPSSTGFEDRVTKPGVSAKTLPLRD